LPAKDFIGGIRRGDLRGFFDDHRARVGGADECGGREDGQRFHVRPASDWLTGHWQVASHGMEALQGLATGHAVETRQRMKKLLRHR
jgi:hypothetical protein